MLLIIGGNIQITRKLMLRDSGHKKFIKLMIVPDMKELDPGYISMVKAFGKAVLILLYQGEKYQKEMTII